MKTNLFLGFTGAWRDPIGVGYPLGNGYRTYLPGLMRFNAPDSFSPFGRGGVNPYAYCAGDPINRSDPSGHFGGISGFLDNSAEQMLHLTENEVTLGVAEDAWAAEKSLRSRPIMKERSSRLSYALSMKRVREARALHASSGPLMPRPAMRWSAFYAHEAFQPHYEITLTENALPLGYSEMHILANSVGDDAFAVLKDPLVLRRGETVETHAIDSGLKRGEIRGAIEQRLLVELRSPDGLGKQVIMRLGTRHEIGDPDEILPQSFMRYVDGLGSAAIKAAFDPSAPARRVFSDAGEYLRFKFEIESVSLWD